MDKRPWTAMGVGSSSAVAMDMFWYREVKHLPDPTKHGAPSAAIAGRMYLYNSAKRGKPIEGDGKVVVEVFDDAPTDGSGAKLLQTVNFPPEVLATMKSSDMIGIGYTLVVPCEPSYKKVHLVARYEPKSGSPFFFTSESITLVHGSPAAGMPPASQIVSR